MDTNYKEFHRRSIEQPEAFWSEQADLIHWHKPFTKVLDYSRPPFTKWFVGGETNLCYNSVDRHLAERGDQNALIFVSTCAYAGVALFLAFKTFQRESVLFRS